MKVKQHTKKLWIISLCLGLAITVILQATLTAQACYHIRENVLRLHILANSDSAQDQALKLKVRDALLLTAGQLFDGTTTKEEAIQAATQSLPFLEQVAKAALEQEGCTLPVTCQIEETYFNTRVYDTVTLPAGTYTALRVLIGQGQGQNWWCVMFPPLCIPAAQAVETQEESLGEVLNSQEQELVENGPKYQMKFKAVEWVQQLKEWLTGW